LIVTIYNHVYRDGMKVSVFNIFLKEGNKAAEKIAGFAVKSDTALKQVSREPHPETSVLKMPPQNV
jgi:hypothetical protein